MVVTSSFWQISKELDCNKLAYSTVFNLYLMLNLLHQNMVPLPIFYSIVSNDWPIRPQSGHSLPSLLTPSLSPLFQFLLCHQTRWCKLYEFKVPSFLIIQDNASENSQNSNYNYWAEQSCCPRGSSFHALKLVNLLPDKLLQCSVEGNGWRLWESQA